MTPEPPSRAPSLRPTTLRPRSLRLDVLLLLALCVVGYMIWPTTHGLTNWQEGVRALVGQQMYERGDWITPTIHQQPYLAKPPMVYWLQLIAARVTGTEPGLIHLRLTVAFAATLGVLLTYFASRRILRSVDVHLDGVAEPNEDANGSALWADHAAFWSAAMLASGILYTRSGRIGELDILLVPFVVGGAWAGFEAWRSHLLHKRTHWLAIAIMLLCTAGAALTKGPPGAMVLLFAACFGPVLRAFLHPRRVVQTGTSHSPLANPFIEIFRAWSRMHPVAIVLVALGSLWGWSLLVARAIGAEAVRAAAGAEADDNLRLFELSAPINNLEAISYGVGLGSVAAIIALIWIIKDRPRLPLGAWAIAAWLVFSLIAFSVLGKGVPRYLTPVWPAIAILGGMWFACAVRDLRIGGGLRKLAYIAVIVMAVGQGLWYGLGRELQAPHRSPRDLVAELLAIPDINADDLISVDLWHPAVDFYAGRFVEPYKLCGPETSFTIGKSRTLEALQSRVQQRPVIALLRESQPPVQRDLPPPIELLRALGFTVEPIPTDAAFLVDAMRSSMRAVRISTADQTAAPDPGE